MKDAADTVTAEMPLDAPKRKTGRPPKHGDRAMTAAERQKEYRRRQREALFNTRCENLAALSDSTLEARLALDLKSLRELEEMGKDAFAEREARYAIPKLGYPAQQYADALDTAQWVVAQALDALINRHGLRKHLKT